MGKSYQSKNKIGLLIFLVLAVLFSSCNTNSTAFYVSPDGNDENSGSKSSPFRSLERAKAEVGQLIGDGMENEEVHVYFREGTYFFEKSVVFSGEEFGAGNNTILFSAFQDEKPVFSGGKIITGWQKVDGNLPYLPEAAKGKIWAADIPVGNPYKIGRFLGKDTISLQNAISGDMSTAEPDEMNVSKDDFMGANYDDPEPYSRFIFADNDLRNWENISDIEVIARPHYGWVSNILPLKSVDIESNVAYTTVPATYYITKLSGSGDDANPNLRVLNAIDHLDEPGEWVIHSLDNKIYYWPEEGVPGDVYYPVTKEIIRLEGSEEDGRIIKNIVFRGITFAHGDRDTMEDGDIGIQHDWAFYNKSDALVRFVDTENCVVDECTFLSSGGGGVRLDSYSQHNKIINNEFRYLGGTAILLSGYGPGNKDVNRNNEIINNRIHNSGESYLHSPALFVWQSGGNRIAHNLIHNIPYTGIVISGPRPQFFNVKWMGNRRELAGTVRWEEVKDIVNPEWQRYAGHANDWDVMFPYLFASDNVIEYNEIHHVMEKMDDGNAIYLSGTGWNNIVRKNYVHHNFSPHRQASLRSDDYAKDITFSDNIIYKFSRAGIVAKYDATITNNYIIDYVPTEMVDGEKHNPLAFIYIGAWGPIKGGIAKNNICYQSAGGSITFLGFGASSRLLESLEEFPKITDYDIDSNLYYAAGMPHSSLEQLKGLHEQKVEHNSLIADPLFDGFESQGFRLKNNSPAFSLGIRQIEFEKMGLLKNGKAE
jgi:hypothetical protein